MPCCSSGRHHALRLFDGARGEPQIDRAAGTLTAVISARVALHVLEAPPHDDGELIDESRLERCKTVLRHADQRRRDRLMRTAFRRQRDARRRRRHHETGILIAGIVELIETTLDEGIVQRRDRQQTDAVDAARQAQGRHQDEQVRLGNAEFEMLALRRKVPVEGGRNLLAAEEIGLLGACEQPAPIDPCAEVGRHGDIGRRGDDARRQFGIAACQLMQHQAEALLRRAFPATA